MPTAFHETELDFIGYVGDVNDKEASAQLLLAMVLFSLRQSFTASTTGKYTVHSHEEH